MFNAKIRLCLYTIVLGISMCLTNSTMAETADSTSRFSNAATNSAPALTAESLTQAVNSESLNPAALAATQATNVSPILPHDLSPYGMFAQADWVVKLVMLGLLLASIATWTVLVAKSRELHKEVKLQQTALAVLCAADNLQTALHTLETQKSRLTLPLAAAEEWQRSEDSLADSDGLKERISSHLTRLEAAAGRQISKGTGILATIGSTAPFVGLFGTVWGIMNSFIGISQSQTTNLAVVAPGIAEALLATALGLVAAIPAVIIYNHFARKITAYKALVADSSAAVMRLVSRDLSRHSVERTLPEALSGKPSLIGKE